MKRRAYEIHKPAPPRTLWFEILVYSVFGLLAALLVWAIA